LKGVCCGPNGSICCPFKYICDEKELTCQLNKTRSIQDENLNKCGSSNVACSSNQTCCKISQSLNDDQYACCDFPHVSFYFILFFDLSDNFCRVFVAMMVDIVVQKVQNVIRNLVDVLLFDILFFS
jgi:hypothetical protein